MTVKHTTGPWNVPFREFTKIKAANGAHIATCHKLTNLVNLEANSRLIAAAPDLLDALKTIIEVIGNTEYGEIDRKLAVKDARAAIAKATYKEP